MCRVAVYFNLWTAPCLWPWQERGRQKVAFFVINSLCIRPRVFLKTFLAGFNQRNCYRHFDLLIPITFKMFFVKFDYDLITQVEVAYLTEVYSSFS